MFTPRVEIIESVKWGKETEHIEMSFKGAGIWCGIKPKDFWKVKKVDEWKKILVKGCRVQLWTMQFSIVLGLQVEINGKWEDAWCLANNFQTTAEAEKSSKAYTDFIMDEGKKIAEWIDEGKNLKQIDKLISNEHSGNTYGWALNIGISKAKNKEKSESIRKEHNAKYGIKESSGVVNPAIMTIETE